MFECEVLNSFSFSRFLVQRVWVFICISLISIMNILKKYKNQPTKLLIINIGYCLLTYHNRLPMIKEGFFKKAKCVVISRLSYISTMKKFYRVGLAFFFLFLSLLIYQYQTIQIFMISLFLLFSTN